MQEKRILYSDLAKIVGYRFWRHIHKETLISPRGATQNRISFLKNLESKLSNMQYVPCPPRAYVVSHKQNLVVRFIPLLTKEDYCVYFFCIKQLEEEIAKNRVKGTYGGWKLGGKIRKIENLDEAPSMPDNSYNRFEWIKAWTDYQQKAFKFYMNNNYKHFIVFDIANFYDSIRLERLELLLREAVGKNKTPIVNLLVYFLSNWGKRDLNYEIQSIGIPQDEVGDCSRVLANFYLQNYDQRLKEIVQREGAGYLRYADDQIVAAKDEETAKRIMFLASKELTKLGLNLNAAKAKSFQDREKFRIYWSFDIFKKLSNHNDKASIEDAYTLYKQRLELKLDFKSDPVIKRLLSCNLYRVSAEVREQIIGMATRDEFLTNANEYYLKRIYGFTKRNAKRRFLSILNNLSEQILFNQFHLRILKFANETHINMKYLNKVKQNLVKLNDMGN